MKLLTHNMLTSNIIKGVTKGYPLKIEAQNVEVREEDFNPEFVVRMLPKIDWGAMYQAAQSVGHAGDVPQTIAEDVKENEDVLKKIHHVMLEIEVKDGDLVCPESGRKFPIKNGILNMLLQEDEV